MHKSDLLDRPTAGVYVDVRTFERESTVGMQQDRDSYDEKLDQILRAAAAVFAEKGYHQASIRDISRATGASLSGLYYYVESKEELLYLVQLRCFATVLEGLEAALDGVDDPMLRFRTFVENHLRFFVGNMREMKVASHEADTLSGEYREQVDEKKRRYAQACSDILSELRPESSPIDLRVATFSLFGMLNWIYTWYRPGRDVPVAELAEDMSQLFLGGLLSGGELALPALAADREPGDAGPSMWRR